MAGDPVRVLMVGPLPPPHHGVSMMTAIVADAFRATGATVRVVDTADRRGIENIGRLDVGNVVLGLRHMVEIWWAAARHRPHLTHLPISQATLPIVRDTLWLLGPRLTGSRLALHLHGSALGRFRERAGGVIRWLLRRLGRRTWRALVLAEAGAGNFAGLVPAEDIRVIPNAIPDPGRVATPGAVPGRFRVVYLANLDRLKGYLTVLHAVARLGDRIPDLEVTIAGSWYSGREEADRLLGDPAVGSRVTMAGVVTGDTKAELLAGADLFVFPPIQPEGQPLVLLEAMAAGLPIVTTASGFIPQTVAEGENAVIIPADDPDALARTFDDLARNPDRLAAMGRASRTLYEARYTPDRLQAHVAALIAELRAES